MSQAQSILFSESEQMIRDLLRTLLVKNLI